MSRTRCACATVAALLTLAVVGLLLAGLIPLRSNERQVTVVGRIVIAHQDGADPTSSRMVPLVETSHGPIPLNLADGLPATPGSLITIEHPRYADGAIVGGAMLGPPTAPSGVPTLGPANFRPGPKKVLVILMQVNGQPASAGAAAIRSSIFTAPNSANAFIQEESFGQLSLTGKLRADGDVYGPYSVVSQQNSTICDNVGWGNLALTQFKTATGMDSESWDNVIVVFQAAQCAFSGVGEVGQLNQGARHSWINAILTGGVPTTSVVAHELGHNFGVDHAGGFECYTGGVRVAFSDACASTIASQLDDQYLDPFDVMGTGVRQENAYHKWESGWLPSSAVQTVIRNGTYLIAPEEAASSGILLLEVPRALGSPSYWLDFRRPFGTWFDTFSESDPVVNGVAIRYGNSPTMPHPSKSWLIDTTPQTTTYDDAPLSVGSTYTDPTRGISITTLSASSAGVRVRVALPNGADTTPPSAPSNPVGAFGSDGLHLSWSSATDDSGVVQEYRVRRDGVLIADVYGTSAVDAAPPAGRTSSYLVTAVDPAGNEGPPARIDVSVGDTAPPSAPTGLVAAVQGSTVHLAWAPASDDVALGAYEVYRDGQLIARVQTTEAGDVLVPVGAHSYSVRAIDSSGNAGAFSAPLIATVAAVVVVPPPVTTARVKTVTSIKLRRMGKHRVVVSWKTQRGALGYQVLRAGKQGKKATLLATVRKVQYVDGRAPTGKLQRSRYVVRALLS